jgi:hypothetical protein
VLHRHCNLDNGEPMKYGVKSSDRWPVEMRAETASEYCDEPSVDAFKAKVKRGIYSQPIRGTGILPKWHRVKLDQDIARRHGLQIDGVTLIEDVSGLI